MLVLGTYATHQLPEHEPSGVGVVAAALARHPSVREGGGTDSEQHLTRHTAQAQDQLPGISLPLLRERGRRRQRAAPERAAQ